MAKNASSTVVKTARRESRRAQASHAQKRKHPGDPGVAHTGSSQIGLLTFDHRQPGDSLGTRYASFLEAVPLIISGLPLSAVSRFGKTSGLTLERIKQLAQISEGSFARRKGSGRLSPQESERMLRISRIFETATGLYDGDQAGARQWLETPIPSLGNHRPLDLAKTEPGAREVEDLIGRIERGIVS